MNEKQKPNAFKNFLKPFSTIFKARKSQRKFQEGFENIRFIFCHSFQLIDGRLITIILCLVTNYQIEIFWTWGNCSYEFCENLLKFVYELKKSLRQWSGFVTLWLHMCLWLFYEFLLLGMCFASCGQRYYSSGCSLCSH